MSFNGAIVSSQPSIPKFKGDKYCFWSVKMQTLFKSHELRDIVESGYSESEQSLAQPSQSY